MRRRPKRKISAPWKRRRRRALIILSAFLIVFGAVAGFRISISNRIEVEYEKIRAEGYPVSPQELKARFESTPASAEGGRLYAQAYAAHTSWIGNNQKLLAYDEAVHAFEDEGSMSDEAASLLREFVDNNEESLALLHEAATKGATRSNLTFPDYSLYSMQLPHLAHVEEAVSLLIWEAILEARDGNATRSVKSIESARWAAESLAFDPMLICQFSRIRNHRRLYDGVEYILNHTQLSDEQLVQLGEILSATDLSEGIDTALSGERCMALEAFDYGYSGNKYINKVLSGTGFTDLDKATYLPLMERVIQASRLEFRTARPVLESIESDVEEQASFRTRGTTSLLPRFANVGKSFANSEAHLTLTITALAIERYRLRENAIPSTLNELVHDFLDSLPLDPLDGRLLRYRPSAQAYTLYSIGWNEKDDGGKSAFKRFTEGDTVFRVDR